MYRETKWESGGLWIKSSPRGNWHPASAGETADYLRELVVSLELRVRELEGNAP